MVGKRRPPGYAPTPLEILNRDHNWRQGHLRRLMTNISIIQDPLDEMSARVLVQAEIDRTRRKYEAKRAELLKK